MVSWNHGKIRMFFWSDRILNLYLWFLFSGSKSEWWSWPWRWQEGWQGQEKEVQTSCTNQSTNQRDQCCQQAATGDTSHSVPLKITQVRIKDYLLMEEEFIRNQEQMKPLEEKQEEERSKVDDLRGTPVSVGSLEEITDDNHAIVSTSVGSEHYVSTLSFVDKDLLGAGFLVLLNHKVMPSYGCSQMTQIPWSQWWR